MTARFNHQHNGMIETCATILEAARAGNADASALTKARLRLSREVAEHCTQEIAYLDARRPRTPSPRVSALLTRYDDDLLRWRHDLITSNCNWPPARVFAESDAFAAEFEELAKRLCDRVRWEEEEFYPVVLYAKAP